MPNGMDGYGDRVDGTKKGLGFFGELKRPDGQISTELSASADVDGQELFFPLLVPTLDQREIDHLLSGKTPTGPIYDKAIAHAQARQQAGKSPFAGEGEQANAEGEEFEFRFRAEREAAQSAAPQEPPSMMDVAGNAAWKGLAGAGDMVLNVAGSVGNALIPPPLRPGAMRDPLRTGMEAVGVIRPENEPQTTGQRVLDTAVQAGVSTAINPASSVTGIVKNAAMGLASGAVSGATKEATGSDLLALAAGVAVPMAAAGAMRSTANAPILNAPVKANTLRDAQAAGYVVPPSMAKPSMTTNKLEGIAGKAAVRQEAAMRNQSITNKLASKAIGLPDDAPITMQSIGEVRQAAAKPYLEVEALRSSPNMPWFPRFHSTSLLEELKQARADTTSLYRSYDRTADPAILKQAKASSTLAQSIEQDIEKVAVSAGKPDLVERLKAARQLYARTYDVERALNLGDGNVSAVIIGRALDKGAKLTGELNIIGRFAQAFPSVTRDGAVVPSPGVSGTEAGMSALLGTVGYGAAGGPAGLLAAGLPLVRGPVRSGLLSNAYQKRLLVSPESFDKAMLQSLSVGRSVADAQTQK